MPAPFLEAVAKAYASLDTDLSNHLFVFPNRRAATIFQKYLISHIKGKVALLPNVVTMSDFVECVSGRVVAQRIESLFILYKSYVRLLREGGVRNVPEFDEFRRWGETALSDFNEVDMQEVDPEELFKNVKDLKEISSNFLDEEQLKVMEEFFGQVYDPKSQAEGFWKDFNEKETENGTVYTKFRLLWQILAPLYQSFNSELKERGLISSGGAYRLAADKLEKATSFSVDADKVVLVGFNALTRSERRIFDSLASMTADDSDEPFADFLWDVVGPVISDRTSAAGRFVLHARDRWPSPAWIAPFIAESDVEGMPPDIKVISVPSNTMQTKIAGDVLQEMAGRVDQKNFDEAKVAVVLPDESLLIPMIYSIPENIKDVNITMGYPMKLSGVAAYVSLLRRMQAGRRKTRNILGFYFKDFEAVLSHPFSLALFGEEVSKVKEWIKKHHRTIVDIHEISLISGKMARLMVPLPDESGPADVVGWLDNILSEVKEALTESDSILIKGKLDIANLDFYRRSLRRMLDLVKEYDIEMQWRTFLTLTDRLISSETVQFEGQPVKGLQVMGMLETRALDFERIVIPSLNERILPARRRARTFISDSLRKAYGLPPVTYSESIIAYYFFRMIARAKEVVLLYDARSSDGARSGDVSRYVLQLQYLYAKENLKLESRNFDISMSELKPREIMKTPEIRKKLSAYRDPGPGGKNLSATALTKFADCQIRFYFENVLGLKTDVESVDYIDAITQGSIIHYVMENIYLPEEKQKRYLEHPELIEPSLIKAIMKDTHEIDRLIRRGINKLHFKLPDDKLDTELKGSAAFVAKVFRSQIRSMLAFDLGQAPFLIYGVEMDGDVSLEMPVGRPVNMRFAIDRLDKVTPPGEHEPRMRIVDYKTGTVHVNAETMEKVFNGDMKGRNILQLWLYANLFDALKEKNIDKKGPRPLLRLFGENADVPRVDMLLEIYDVNSMRSEKHTYPKFGKDECKIHTEQNKEFIEYLEVMLLDLFDDDKPFKHANDTSSCNFCQFKTICWR